ncbi:hypothetical protein KA001_02675 [Patescibacteria group bacterium]|nr:hypothetical protein [Patescibacteria group bacterium]
MQKDTGTPRIEAEDTVGGTLLHTPESGTPGIAPEIVAGIQEEGTIINGAYVTKAQLEEFNRLLQQWANGHEGHDVWNYSNSF